MVDRHETVLSAERPTRATDNHRNDGWVAGDLLISERREDGWYAVLTGIDGGTGSHYESDDFGPYPTRAEAEAAGRDAYESPEEPA